MKSGLLCVRFEKVNARIWNVYLCKCMGREAKGAVVDMEDKPLP